jgi:hypothetical protein
MRLRVLATAASLCLPAVTAHAQADFDALKASGEISNDLARRDIDAAASVAARLMIATSVNKLKSTFDLARDYGQGEYVDLVYARDYGRTEKDIIYKIDYEKAFLFIRFLYHVDRGAWRLIHVDLKIEDELPFPKDWPHIYPK